MIDDFLLKRIYRSEQLGMRLLRSVLLLCFVALVAINLRHIVCALQPPVIYSKDLVQEYLAGRAILAGQTPYSPISDLAKTYLPDAEVAFLPHPTPHPPPVVLLSLPLALMSYQTASVVWLVLEILVIASIWWFLSSWMQLNLGIGGVVVGTFVAIGWTPFMQELLYGQLMIVLLLFLVLCGLAYHRGRSVWAGVFLGITLSLKLLGWPILVYWMLKRQWRSVAAATGTALLINIVASLVVTPEVLLDYYIRIPELVAPLYRSNPFNFSPLTVGWRFFEGTGSQVLLGFAAPPLAHMPGVASYVSVLVMAAVLIVGLRLALCTHVADVAFMILVCLSTLTTAVVWIHYFTWLLPPLVYLFRQLRSQEFPLGLSIGGVIVIVALALPASTLAGFACILSGNSACVDEQVSFLAGLVTYLQPLAVVLMMWLLSRADGNRSTSAI